MKIGVLWKGVCRVVGWIEMYEMTKKKLDRELKQQEIDFLKWVYEKHKKEEKLKMETK